jgi:hypothetical protein
MLRDGDRLGTRLTVMDMNGDGYMDIIATAYADDSGGVDRGAVYVLLSSPWMTGIAQDIDECYLGMHNCGTFGICTNTLGSFECSARLGTWAGGISLPLADTSQIFGVSAGGDLNKDGIRDMALGAYSANAVYLVFMDSSGTSARSFATIQSGTAGFTTFSGQDFGISGSMGGDVNIDTIIDLAVGARNTADGGSSRGALYIIFASPAGGVKSFVRISSSSFTGSLQDGAGFGISVSMSVDLNGDGTVDLAVGAWRDTDGGTDAGAVYIFFLQTSGSYKSFRKISGIAGSVLNGGNGFVAGQQVGYDVSWNTGSDLNGDGIPDLGVGCWVGNAVFIVFLGRDGTAMSYTKITTGMSGFTWTTSGLLGAIDLGDLNGDGHPDAVIGSQVMLGEKGRERRVDREGEILGRPDRKRGEGGREKGGTGRQRQAKTQA